MQVLRHFLLAVQFFSRIPVTGRLATWVGWSPQLQQASAAHLPGVGWLVGGVAATSIGMCYYALPDHPMLPWVAAVISTLMALCVTGGLHEDGLADVADGLGGHLPAERALDVMKDSRIGAYGAMALCTALIAKIVFVALIASSDIAAAAWLVLCIHVLSRAAPLALMRTLPHVSKPATSKTLHIAGQPLSWRGLLTGILWSTPALLIIGCLISWHVAAALLLTTVLIATYMRWRFWCRLGGMTGDCLGATQQLCELGMYLCAGLLLANRS